MKKLYALLMAVVMIISCSVFTLGAFAEESAAPTEAERIEAASKWDGTVYTVTSDAEIYTFEGSGTKKAPYLLQSADDVAKFAANVRYNSAATNYSKKYFKLTCDLDFQNKEWVGIGGVFNETKWDENCMFAGVFDGDGHVVYNFNLADKNSEEQSLVANGFFGYVGYAEIHNFGIASGDVEITGSSTRIGALIGASRYNLTVKNCFSRANITYNLTGATEVRVGGLMGAVMNDGTTVRVIENCYNSGNITLNVLSEGQADHNVGGIAGYLTDGTISLKNCYNTGAITVSANYGETIKDMFRVGVGSLVGTMPWGGTYSFENCGAGGSITYTNSNDTPGTPSIGAIVGHTCDASWGSTTFAAGNVYSVDVEQVVGYWIGGTQPTNVTKVDAVTVPVAEGELYFIEALKADENTGNENTGNENTGNENTGNENTGNENTGNENTGNNNTSGNTTTAPETNATTTTAPVEEESGCASVAGIGAVAVLAIVGAACTMRKKED